jgi:hypothetical protein
MTGRFLKQFLIKTTSLFFIILSELKIFYFIIGFLNKRLHFIDSVFLCYSGNSSYANYYTFKFSRNWQKWRPTPIGILYQGKKWGLVVGSPMSEKEFTNKNNNDDLFLLLNRTTEIADLIHAKKITLAGILPSYLDKINFEVKGNDNRLTALTVYHSYHSLINSEFSGESVPAILLGGNGSVGKILQTIFQDHKNYNFFVIDPIGGLPSLPEKIINQKCILIDVSRYKAISQYVDDLWDGIVILNETYPEPPKKLIRKLKSKGIKTFHLCGVNGRIYPSLPHGYRDSVPCCAIHDDSVDLEPNLIELSR